jgi:hypothetical protein
MTHPKHAPKRLTDLRPATAAAAVPCMVCQKPTTREGAMAFHAHWVCAGCAVKVRNEKKEKTQ